MNNSRFRNQSSRGGCEALIPLCVPPCNHKTVAVLPKDEWEEVKEPLQAAGIRPKMHANVMQAIRSSKGKPRSRGPKSAPGSSGRGRRVKDLGQYTVSDIGRVAEQAWEGVKYIKSLINVEQKFNDVYVSPATITTSAVVTNLSNIVQGTDVSTRDGDSILAQKLRVKYRAIANNTAGVNLLRVVIFQDRDQRGVDPAYADLFVSTASAVTGHKQFYGNLRNPRFRFLYDATHTLTQGGNNQIIFHDCVIPIHNHIFYTTTTGVDAANWEGALFLLVVSDDMTNGPQFLGSFRLEFTDN